MIVCLLYRRYMYVQTVTSRENYQQKASRLLLQRYAKDFGNIGNAQLDNTSVNVGYRISRRIPSFVDRMRREVNWL